MFHFLCLLNYSHFSVHFRAVGDGEVRVCGLVSEIQIVSYVSLRTLIDGDWPITFPSLPL